MVGSVPCGGHSSVRAGRAASGPPLPEFNHVPKRRRFPALVCAAFRPARPSARGVWAHSSKSRESAYEHLCTPAQWRNGTERPFKRPDQVPNGVGNKTRSSEGERPKGALTKTTLNCQPNNTAIKQYSSRQEAIAAGTRKRSDLGFQVLGRAGTI